MKYALVSEKQPSIGEGMVGSKEAGSKFSFAYLNKIFHSTISFGDIFIVNVI